MNWCDALLDRLAASPCCGYGRADAAATEPTALAAMALATARRIEPARQAADWLAAIQSADGSVGVRASEPEPCWPTSLAVLAWAALTEIDQSVRYQSCIELAARWIVTQRAAVSPKCEDHGHDSTLAAWPWVDGTHSWIEPTALNVLALKAIGQSAHPRARDGVVMLVNRQLDGGGFNYGNTVVFNSVLRPHLQPTGMALLALEGELDRAQRVPLSLAYLRRELSPATTVPSLAWSLLGLAAHGIRLDDAESWLERASRRTIERDLSPHKLVLIANAFYANQSPLVHLPRKPIVLLRTGTSSAAATKQL